MSLIKRLFCRHDYSIFIRNIYGDEIIWVSPANKTYRSFWECSKCGSIKGKEFLHYPDKTQQQ